MIPDALLPIAPGWLVDWPALDTEFEWVRAMKDCKQDPRYHAEGNVWTHTRMVLESLVSIEGFRTLPDEDRRIVFLAALLHDVAKPLVTKIESDGRITSRGHSNRGETMSRLLMWRAGVPFEEREQVAALVRHHQVPFFLLDRENPERTARAISLRTRCDWLGLVAEADARGRRCSSDADQNQILGNVDLFRELCSDLDCLKSPAEFSSAVGRFEYFWKPDRVYGYDAYDESRCEVVMLSGLPASGKDSWIRRSLPDWPVISLDEIRSDLGVSARGNQSRVLARARESAKGYLRAGTSFAWNGTNLVRHLRRQLVEFFVDHGARVRIVYLESDEESLRRRNREREESVPRAGIERMLERWTVPDRTEAHTVEYLVD